MMTPERRCCSSGRSGFAKRPTAPTTPTRYERSSTWRSSIKRQATTPERDNVMSARSRLREQFRGPADLLTLHVLTGMAVVLSDLAGDFAGSARLNERLLALTERAFGPTDPRLRTPLENLAMDLRDLGDYAAAKAAGRTLAGDCRAGARSETSPRLPGVCTRWPRSSRDWVTMPRPCGCSSAPHESTRRCCSRRIAKLLAASWFIPRLVAPLRLRLGRHGPLRAGARDSREARRPRRPPHGRKPEQSRRGAVQPQRTYRRTRPLFERALDVAGEIPGPGPSRGRQPPPPISPMCCRAPARTTGRSGCTSAR